MDLEIDGIGTLEIGDLFKDMSPEDQNAYVDHIREQVRQGKKSGLSTMPRASEFWREHDSGRRPLYSRRHSVRLAHRGSGEDI